MSINCLLCGSLRISAFSAFNGNFNAEVAEIRRGPQRKRILILLVFALIVAQSANAAIRLPTIISDNMVLQQGIKVRIWGSANAGEHVAVTFDKKTSDIIADAQGRWQVLLGPFKAGGPFELTVKGDNVLTIKNVLVGEVWLLKDIGS